MLIAIPTFDMAVRNRRLYRCCGHGNGTIEAQGDTVAQALEQLDDKLQARREFFQQKINEIDQALFDVRTLISEAEELENK